MCAKLRNLTTSILFFRLCTGCRSTSDTSYSMRNLDHLLQFSVSHIYIYIPRYLSDLLQPYTPTRLLWFALNPRVNIIVKRSRFCWFLFCFVFNILYPSVCNSLPQTLRHPDYSSSFRTALKSVLNCPLKVEEFVLTFCVSRSLFQNFLKHVFFTDVAITAAATVSKCVCECVCACARARACVCVCACWTRPYDFQWPWLFSDRDHS